MTIRSRRVGRLGRPSSFRWADAASLLGTALAAGAAAAYCDAEMVRDNPGYADLAFRWGRLSEWFPPMAVRLRQDLFAFLSVAGLGLAALMVRESGTSGRRRRIGPGRIAVFIDVLVAITLVPLAGLGRWLEGAERQVFHRFWVFLIQYENLVTWMVFGAWVALAIGGRWRGPADWRERLGRWWGWTWLALVVIYRLLWPSAFG